MTFLLAHCVKRYRTRLFMKFLKASFFRSLLSASPSVFAISITLLLTACGKSKSNPQAFYFDTFTVQPREPISTAILKATVTCAEAHCSPAVGLLAFENKTQCTGFLIGPQKIITNAHCLKNVSADSLPQSVIAFPKTDLLNAETISLKSILQVTDYDVNDPSQSIDLAVLELSAPTLRPYLEIDSSGVEANETLEAWVVTPSSSAEFSGTLEKKLCTSVTNSALLPSYQSSLDPVILVGDCVLHPGNSGSPLVSASGASTGKVKSVLQAIIEKQYLPQLSKIAKNKLQPMNIASLARCAQGACHALQNPAALKLRMEQVTQNLIHSQAISALQEQATQLFQKSLPLAIESSNIAWKSIPIQNQKDEIVFVPFPKCFLDLPKVSELKIEIPHLEIGTQWSVFFQPSLILEPTTPYGKTTYQWDNKNLYRKGESLVSAFYSQKKPAKVEWVSFCDDDQSSSDENKSDEK